MPRVTQLPALLPCPFCGSESVAPTNTHTPYFSVECEDCGAEVSGQSFGKHSERKWHYDPEARPSDKFDATYAELPANYRKAARSACDAWNRRSAP
jgi:hypothetical protein